MKYPIPAGAESESRLDQKPLDATIIPTGVPGGARGNTEYAMQALPR